MDREQAYILLGLYAGAPAEHVKTKYAQLAAELELQLQAGDQPALKTQLEQLAVARDVALGAVDATQVSTSSASVAHVPVWRRGPVVLLALLLLLVVCVAGFFVAAKQLDKKQAARITAGQRERAETAQAAWDSYRAKLGLKQTPDGERAQALFDGAKLLDEQEDFAHAGEDYVTALELFDTAFKSEGGRLEREWKSQVVDFWRASLKGRFPFSQSSEEEARAEDVATLFNPVSGRIWSLVRQYDALASTELDGLSMATLPTGYAQTVEQAMRIRTALFGANSEQIDVIFSIKIEDVKSLHELLVETGGARITSRDKNFVSATWTPGFAGARLLLRKVGERSPVDGPLDYSDSDWGGLQLLNHCTFDGERDGAFVWAFELEGPDDRRGNTRTMTGTIHIKVDREVCPFDLTTYSAFQPE